MELSFYHGSLSKEDGEKLLQEQGKNGSYLLRKSESVNGALCLCILVGRLIYTYRVSQNSEGLYKLQTAKGVKEKYFHNLKDLIANYEKPNQGLVHPLLYPVSTETQFQPRRFMNSVVQENDTYAEIDEREYVEVLPS